MTFSAMAVGLTRGALARVVALALACAGGLAGCAAVRPTPAASAPALEASATAAPSGFTILTINDTYKIEGLEAGRVGGMARVRALRKMLEDEGRPVLVLHAGDLLFPSVASKYLDGAAMIDVLGHLDGSDGFDPHLIATFGNHEFDQRDPQVLLDRLAESRFRWVSSNVRFRTDPNSAPRSLSTRFDHVLKTVTLELGGVRVGVFGLTLDDVSRDWLTIDYRDQEARGRAVRAALDALDAAGAEMIIALTHQELGEDERLARDFPEIDWIVGGHEHVYLTRRVNDTWITKADADAKSAVVIDVRREEGHPVGRQRKFDLAGGEIPPDPEIQGLVARWLVRLERVVEERTGLRLLDVVATTEHALEGVEPAIRGRETALGNLLTDVLRERLGTDIAFINGGAIRVNDDVPAGGDLRIYELEGIFYYDNRPVAFGLKGAELLELLRKSVSETTIGHGRFLQVSGLRFRYTARSTAAGEATRVDAKDVEVRDRSSGKLEPLDLDRTYSVASLDYLWQYGFRDGYPLFSAGAGGTSPPRLARPELSWRGITEEAIGALPGRRIRTDIEGRIVRIVETLAGETRKEKR